MKFVKQMFSYRSVRFPNLILIMGEMETRLKFKIIVSISFIKKSKVKRTEWGNT